MSTERFARNHFDAELVARALRDDDFRHKLLADPTATYAEELQSVRPGQLIPEGVQMKVVEEAEDVFYVVLPCIPRGMELTDEALGRVARRERTHRKPCWGLGDAPD